MKSEQIQKFKALFESQKRNLTHSSKMLIDEFSVKSEEMADEVDLTSAELEQGMRMRLRSREALFLNKVESALHKIHAGTFGQCEDCEEEIEFSRLEVRPTATLCITCKESEEALELRSAEGLQTKSLGQRIALRIA
jgi:DnaK suppressor protein